MAATPKTKPPSTPVRASRADRTSAVVAATLILLTALGIVTVFWEPLTALAVGAPAAESVGETRAAVGDAGTPASTPGAHDASGSS
jgi:hypothetical protein